MFANTPFPLFNEGSRRSYLVKYPERKSDVAIIDMLKMILLKLNNNASSSEISKVLDEIGKLDTVDVEIDYNRLVGEIINALGQGILTTDTFNQSLGVNKENNTTVNLPELSSTVGSSNNLTNFTTKNITSAINELPTKISQSIVIPNYDNQLELLGQENEYTNIDLSSTSVNNIPTALQLLNNEIKQILSTTGSSNDYTNIDNADDIPSALQNIYTKINALPTESPDLSLLGEANDYHTISDSGNDTNVDNVPKALTQIYNKIKNISSTGGGYDDENLRKLLYTMATGDDSQQSISWENVINVYKNSDDTQSGNNFQSLIKAIEKINTEGGSGGGTQQVDLTDLYKMLYYIVNGKATEDGEYTIDDIINLFDAENNKPSLQYLSTTLEQHSETLSNISNKLNNITVNNLNDPIYDYTVEIDETNKQPNITIGNTEGFALYFYALDKLYGDNEITCPNGDLLYINISFDNVKVSNNKFVFNNSIQGLTPCVVDINGTVYNKPTGYNTNKSPIGDKVGFRLESIENVYIVGNGVSEQTT